MVRIRLNASHKLYNGHFPDNPITPGVVMLQILKELSEIHLQKKLLLKEASNVKFLSLVNPNIDNELLFNIKFEEDNEIFHVKNNTTFPDGRIVLKCNATFVIR